MKEERERKRKNVYSSSVTALDSPVYFSFDQTNSDFWACVLENLERFARVGNYQIISDQLIG